MISRNFPNTELILSRPEIACDVETTGKLWWKDRVFGASIAWRNDDGTYQAFYGDIRDQTTYRWFRDHVPRARRVVNHHIKFDVHMMRESRILLDHRRIHCTMVREAILDEHTYENNLDSLGYKYLKEYKDAPWVELARLFGGPATRDAQILNLHKAPFEIVERYANKDSTNALKIFHEQQTHLDEQQLAEIDKMEQRLLGVVIKMEHGGVRVDVDLAEQAANYLDKEVYKQQKELNRLAGYSVNVNSNPQVKKLLGVHQDEEGRWWTGDKVRLEPTESGLSGSLKTEKLYQSQIPAAKYIADIRAMIKARDVFLRTYVMGMSHNEYIHANINQTRNEEGDGTYTGRFSITDPALQQIHKRNKKLAAIVRACFIPDREHDWVCYDWSQKDFRIFAHYVNDPKINAIYQQNPAADFHRVTSDITGLPRDRDQKTGGANAKQMNLGLIFGMSAGRMAKEMFLPYTLAGKCFKCRTSTTRNQCPNCGNSVRVFFQPGPEAKGLFAKYHTNIPGAERLKQSVASVARSRGYIKTQLGRRLRFTKNDAYKAAGILFQGQAAESMKWKCVELDEYLTANPGVGRFKLVVHDEFDTSMRIGRDPRHDQEIKALLERFDGVGCPLNYRVPILADYGVGPDWYEASK